MTVLKVAFVLGESSGDRLGADLLPTLRMMAEENGQTIETCGLAGPLLAKQGCASLFDIEEIAVMGFSAVIARLPTIMRRVYQTVDHLVQQKPDIVVLIDSPDFTHAVAKRFRRKCPDVPIINYVCPSVWAWRPGRAVKMRAYVDHVLTLLPFEPKALEDLNGPLGTYVGHPLVREIEQWKADHQVERQSEPPLLVVLPGSRGSELKRHLTMFVDAMVELKRMGVAFEAVMPAVPHLKSQMESAAKDWPIPVTIVDAEDNNETFARAHFALAASGTVSLQLALHGVPMTVAYKLDPVARPFGHLIKVWSVVLPNLIADWPFVSEDLNEQAHPIKLAKRLARLAADTPERQRLFEGFADVHRAVATPRPPAEVAAEVILQHTSR